MKIEKIRIVNFCGIDNLEIDFEDDVTVIAGINGIGKSSILHAVKHVVHYSLRKSLDLKETKLSIDNSTIKNGREYTNLSGTISCKDLPLTVDFRQQAVLPSAQKEKLSEEVGELYKEYANSYCPPGEKAEIMEEIVKLEDKIKPKGDFFVTGSELNNIKSLCKSSYPLAVFYSTTRLFSRKGLSSKLSDAKPLTKGSANTGALDQNEISLSKFTEWYRSFAELRKYSWDEMDSQIRKAIKGILGDEFHSLGLELKPKPRFTIKKNTEVLFLDQLSDGEQGLLSLVFDLTRRLATANPDSEDPIKEGHALVLIDEIELHLHPAWQRRVIKRLTKTFANCQFIVTTHSPQIVGEVEARCVRLLSFDDNNRVQSAVPDQALGADSNWILNVLMGTNELNEDAQAALDKISELISEKNIEEARRLINIFHDDFGRTEQIQRYTSLVERIERLGR